MRLFLQGDASDFVLAHIHAAVGPIQVGIITSTRLEFQGLCLFIEGPDTCEGHIQVADHQLGALLEHRL